MPSSFVGLVEHGEPNGLPVVRALYLCISNLSQLSSVREAYLARHLEVQILLHQRPVLDGAGAQLALLVIRLDEVLDNGARLPESKVGVGVDNGGQAAVGVDGDEGLALGVLDEDLYDSVLVYDI